MPEVAMPRLSDAMEDGTIVAWLAKDGDQVVPGQEIVEIETDKATMSFEANASGTLAILAAAGTVVAVGAPICSIGGAPAPPVVDSVPASTPLEVVAAREAAAPVPEAEANGGSTGGGRIKASPVARRVAHQRSVDLALVVGTGPGGRIVRADVEHHRPAAIEAAPPGNAPSPDVASGSRSVASARGEVVIDQPSRQQQVVMRRMAEAKATIPDFSITTDLDAAALVDLREQLRALADPLPSLNDLVVKACAIALREFPRVNGGYRDGQIERYARVNIGVAVATDDALVVPTIFDADAMGLQAIASSSRTLASRARDKTITPPELGGGTFTISNLGMFGITSFTAIINPPQAAILAVGSLRTKLSLTDGLVVEQPRMTLTLVCDHRVLNGAEAARFLARIRALLERPVGLAL